MLMETRTSEAAQMLRWTFMITQDWEEGDGDYLAPELLQEAKPTPAADIFSLGATLYECASGTSQTFCEGFD